MFPVGVLFDVVSKTIDKLFPDPVKKQEAALKLLELQQSGDLAVIAAQADINKVEATNPNIFISGWRPFIGWICGSGLAIQFVIGPMLGAFDIKVPSLDMGTLTTLLIGMLGLGGMRTVEKLSGAEAKRS